ncbi:MAG: carboxypeptidase regulatory-like domain-containing protein, partial [Thermoplasmata archaeon]|nr:carboxypeptidase regulatory-like domain-containing protein [Thermoplasmata archaeon]
MKPRRAALLLGAFLLVSACSFPVSSAPLILSIEYSVEPDEVYVNGSFSVSGTVKLAEALTSNVAVNVSIEKISPSIWNETITDTHGTFFVSLEAELSPGNYSINITADDGLGHTTYNISSIEVLPPPASVPDPMVSSLDIDIWPKYIDTAEKVYINVTVRNVGTADAWTRVRIFRGYPAEGDILKTENIFLEAGGMNITKAVWMAKSGPQTITSVVDQVTPEDSNLTNNQASVQIIVNDIEPPTIGVPEAIPISPLSGDMISILVIVEDDLNLSAADPAQLHYMSEMEEWSIPMETTKDGFVATIGPFSYGSIYYNISAIDSEGNPATTPNYKLDIGHSDIVVDV